jgi:hypothetical protein
MKRILLLIAVNIDVVVALLLSVLFGLLDVVGAVSTTVMNGVVVLTLAALAASMLHNRLRDEAGISRLQVLLAQWLGDEAVKVLNGLEISRALAESRSTTGHWEFKGGTGTYTRAVTLPKMAQAARDARKQHVIRLEVLDPSDLELCTQYADFFRGLATGDDSEAGWTGEGTRLEVLATVLAACRYQKQASLLDVHVHLSTSMTIMRWDRTDDRLIITHRGPRYPALLVQKGNRYFDILSSELMVSRQQARRLPMDTLGPVKLGKNPTVDEVRALFEHLELPLPAEFTDDDVVELIEKGFETTDPYAGST